MRWLVVLAILMASMGSLCAAEMPTLVGMLEAPALWQSYKSAFISSGGRVIDNANGDISHSEGQGYAMLLAVAADDPQTFSLVWNWTRAQLMFRDDGLAAWRWDPAATPHVADRNNATDGDLLIAWALAEAGKAWSVSAYSTASLRLTQAISKVAVTETPTGPILKPGAKGFEAADRADGPVINLSYWVFPALARFAAIAPDQLWGRLIASGLALTQHARFGASGLPSDWIALDRGAPRPAQGFAPTFGYDAVRIPLYLLLAGIDDKDLLAVFAKPWADPAAVPQRIDVSKNQDVEPLGDSGYRAIAALTRCAVDGTKLPPDLASPDVDRYYPTTMRALVLIAAHQKYRQCL
jgi:endoglucanase